MFPTGPCIGQPASFCLWLPKHWVGMYLWRVISFSFSFKISLYIFPPLLDFGSYVSLCLCVSSFLLSQMIILSFPSWLGFLIRSDATSAPTCVESVLPIFTHFPFLLSECSTECRGPKINCRLMSYRKCARNRYQTQTSAPKIWFLSFWVLVRLVRTLHIDQGKMLLIMSIIIKQIPSLTINSL